MKKYVIVCDRGSTNVKAVVFNTQAEEVLTTTYANPDPILPQPGWRELDMELNWKSVSSAIKKIFDQSDIRPEEILGINITGQGSGLTFIDKSGHATSISSLDSRTADLYAEWQANGLFEKAAQLAGTIFIAPSAMPMLAWLKANTPDVYQSIDTVLYVIDWMNYKLTGVIGTQTADMSSAGMMDLRTGTCEYNYEVLDLLGIGYIKDKLPPIQMCHERRCTVTKEAAEQTGLLEGTPVFAGSYDIPLFPFGVGTLSPSELVHSLGTWAISVRPAASMADVGMLSMYHPVPGYYITGMGDSVAGCCLDFTLGALCDYENQEAVKCGKCVYEYVEDKVNNTKPTGILFHPYPFGSLFNKHAGAGYTGLKYWHTKDDMLRAVYEGMVMGYKAYSGLVAGADKCDVHWILGGGAKSKVFGQLFADIFGVTVKVPKSSEITARGAALCALVGLGVFKDFQEACIPVEVKAEYKPNPDMQAFYARKFEAFTESMQNLQGIWNKLSTLESGM